VLLRPFRGDAGSNAGAPGNMIRAPLRSARLPTTDHRSLLPLPLCPRAWYDRDDATGLDEIDGAETTRPARTGRAGRGQLPAAEAERPLKKEPRYRKGKAGCWVLVSSARYASNQTQAHKTTFCLDKGAWISYNGCNRLHCPHGVQPNHLT